MWQRIQTLWLLLSGIAMTLLLFKPMGMLLERVSGKGYELGVFGIKSSGSGYEHFTWGFFILAALIVGLSFLTIFLYKKRILQIRFCVFNILLTIGFLGYFGFLIWSFSKTCDCGISFTPWLSIPIVSIILQYLALRRIGVDEAMVRAANRLR